MKKLFLAAVAATVVFSGSAFAQAVQAPQVVAPAVPSVPSVPKPNVPAVPNASSVTNAAKDQANQMKDKAVSQAKSQATEKLSPADRTKKSAECIKQADEKGLHGKARKLFKKECKSAN